MNDFIVQLIAIIGIYLIAFALTPVVRSVIGPPDMNSRREPQLDGLRGLAAVGVLACHVNQYTYAFLGHTAAPLFGNHVGILSVQLFFCLTAYLFASRALAGKLEPETFYIGRVKRILPLYTSVFVAGVMIASVISKESGVLVERIAREAIQVFSYGFWKTDVLTFLGVNMLPLVGIAWTLSYEWAFYLLLVPGYFIWRSGACAKWALASLVIILVIRDFRAQSEQIIWPFFLPGILSAAMAKPLPRAMRILLSMLALPAVFMIFWLPGFWTWQKLLLCALLFMFVAHSWPRWLAWSPLRTIGSISYSIYLIQYLVLYPATLLIFSLPALASVPARLVVMAIVPVVTIVLASMTYRWIEAPWHTHKGTPTHRRGYEALGSVVMKFEAKE